ncbi:MAG TPA: hypothetical protein VGQ09_07440 [Chitinophagaceae bacterium]|jgi:hypothetical protein|nr:hypothetical protein [Chitinophagaceae bacterium]
MQTKICPLVLLFLFSISIFAQHQHDQMPMNKTVMKKDTVPTKNKMTGMDMKKDTMPSKHMHGMDTMKEMGGMKQHEMSMMSHSYSLNLPMNRNGSGTGWLPDASPMYGYMIHSKNWMYMVHGNVFMRYDNQDIGKDGSRGAEKWDAPNWLMLMGQRKIGRNGLFHSSSMFSLDAAVAGKTGYPLLFQTGETAYGQPLVDRQHPHDLFSELSVSYSYALSKKFDVFVYLGYPGEPALGSVTFMHRPSALFNPDAPLSHHWNDGTHITFGVATVGVRLDKFKVEASSFTGREPDENRYDFDKPKFDSWSGRLSYNPTENWALQASRGFVKSPEVLHPEEDVNRTTASAIYSHELPMKSMLNITALWGLNKIEDHKGENAFLLEGAWNKDRFALYTRYEWIQKSVEELNLQSIFADAKSVVFPINALTLGFNYNLLKYKNTWLSAGSHITIFDADDRLDNLYGKHPVGLEVYLRIHPALMHM